MMYTGTTAEQDNRFSDKEKKLLKQMKFDNNLQKPVDMTKVKLDVIKPWIAQKITEVLGIEDDVIVHFVFNQLEAKFPDPKKMQINLTGFLNGKNARMFMSELWELLLSAQESVSGIPEQFMEKKKEEIKKRMEEAERLQESTKKQLEKSKDKDKDRDKEKDRDRKRDRSRSRSSRKRSRSRDRDRDRDRHRDRRDKKDKDKESRRSITKSPSRNEKKDREHSVKKEVENEQKLDNGKERSSSPAEEEKKP